MLPSQVPAAVSSPQSRRRVQLSPQLGASSNFLLPPPPQAARRLAGRYEVVPTPIGEGAFGRVYPAFDYTENRPVAVKMLGRRVFDTLEEARRVLREIHLMAHFRRHPYIVDMYDLLEMPGVRSPPTLVLELMECNLDELLGTNSRVNEAHAILFTKQILIALDVVHTANVMHRDLTTRNVLIHVTEAREFHVKICDMGLARAQPQEDENDDAVPFSRALSSAVTTRWWQAPEMLVHGRYDKSVDIWAVGCILGQMLRPCRGSQVKRNAEEQRSEQWRPEEGCRRGLFKGRCNEETLGLIVELLGSPPDHVLAKIGGAPYPHLEDGRTPRDFAQYFQRPEGGPVSPAGLHLLQRMLHFDPECRITAHEALLHPYLLDDQDKFVWVPYREVYEPLPEDSEALPDIEAQIRAEVQAVQEILKRPPVDIKRPILRPLTPPRPSSFRIAPRTTSATSSSLRAPGPSPPWVVAPPWSPAPSPPRAVAPSPPRPPSTPKPAPPPSPPRVSVVPTEGVHITMEEAVKEVTTVVALVADLETEAVAEPKRPATEATISPCRAETERPFVHRRRSPGHPGHIGYADFGNFARTFPKSADDSLHQLFRQWTSFSDDHELDEENYFVREDGPDYGFMRMETTYDDLEGDEIEITRSMTEYADLEDLEKSRARFQRSRMDAPSPIVSSPWAAAVESSAASAEEVAGQCSCRMATPRSREEEVRPSFGAFAIS